MENDELRNNIVSVFEPKSKEYNLYLVKYIGKENSLLTDPDCVMYYEHIYSSKNRRASYWSYWPTRGANPFCNRKDEVKILDDVIANLLFLK